MENTSKYLATHQKPEEIPGVSQIVPVTQSFELGSLTTVLLTPTGQREGQSKQPNCQFPQSEITQVYSGLFFLSHILFFFFFFLIKSSCFSRRGIIFLFYFFYLPVISISFLTQITVFRSQMTSFSASPCCSVLALALQYSSRCMIICQYVRSQK